MGIWWNQTGGIGIIFRNKDVTENKNDYLFVDDDLTSDCKPIPEKVFENMPPRKGKEIIGTFGVFNIKDFERNVRGLKNV